MSAKIIFFALLVFLLLPQRAKAGVFSFFQEVFAGSSIEESVSSTNTQNMPILQAVAHTNPNPTKGGADFSIVDDSALQSTMGPSGASAEVVEKASSDKISVYVVREGDTLSEIASMYDVSVNTIIWANDLGSARSLKNGQTLVILPISGIKHVVKKGESVKSISSKYDADPDEIIDFNNISDSGNLAVGTEILIPYAEMPAPAVTSSKVVKTQSSSGTNVSSSGYFMRPISGGIKTQGIHGKNGVDLADKLGTPIYASASGKVIISRSSGWNGGYGNYIVISHPNGTQTLYAHLSKNLVSAGSSVSKGDQIGAMGSTGKSTGSHLHFEIRGTRNPF